MSRRRFLFDDRDPGIVYGDTGWNTYDLAVPPINHTLSYTNGPGCELTYTFQGTGISMYGMLDASDHGGTTLDLEVTVDDQAPTQFQPPLPSSSFNYGNRYFLLKDLEYGNHTVKVKNTNNETVEFDYFLVTPGTAPLTLTASTSTTPSATNTPDPVAKDGDKRSTPVGAIVGGVMGGLVLLGLIGAFLVWMKRRNRKAQQRVYHSEEDLIPHTEPFPYSAAPSGQQASGTSPISTGQKGRVVLTANTSGVPSQSRKSEKSAYAQTGISSAPSPQFSR
ncbi:hypothetical protein K435DRAFT_467444 [Dendrothele bispora CBS 962.96]|uniref:Mid2 domain-containing protein n=1 Tax=Dendrothele bispora (strain CBS 962.96) TaxID=1314807 RepID=A0A4S8L0S8_DENBC|nr:hypothetical protein K435DRAFT_467444 [Dendrothele bispora CBS 962.96]